MFAVNQKRARSLENADTLISSALTKITLKNTQRQCY